MTTATIIAQGKTFTNFIGKERLLGKYPGAVVAYSMRHIGTSYVGPLIRVRRSLDSKEQDFYAIDGWISVSELKAFVGQGSGYVSIWYDQSGNSNHAIQQTPAAQPAIIINGVISSFGSRMCAFFDGVDDFMPLPESICALFNSGNGDYGIYASCLYGLNITASLLALSSKTNPDPEQNNFMLYQTNRRSKSIGMYVQNYNGRTNDILSATNAVSNRVYGICFARENMQIKLIDQGGSKTEAVINLGQQNYKLVTMGGVRRGTNEELIATDIKVGEFIIYDKSHMSMSEEITANIQNAFA
ncbi:arabinofuranosidase catalytic domain-containing protein [Providencia rettgeri]